MNKKHKVVVILGIRPDFIRTSIVLRLLKNHPRIDATFVHTGQHYDKELSGVFFEQLNVPFPDYQLDCRGKTHCEQHAKLIAQLEPVMDEVEPDICLFLGDANATIGCIVPLKKGVPIAHIEAGMRSYDWKMPEERNRVLIDRMSDVLYVYQDDYRVQLVQEGISPDKIEVVGNVIVDVINEQDKKHYFDWPVRPTNPPHCMPFKTSKWEYRDGPRKYALMTLHRDEHMRNPKLAQSIINQVGLATSKRNLPVILIEMPRLKSLNLEYPDHFLVTPPLGYIEFGTLEKNAAIEYTDSGTNQESASIFGTPCVVTRDCTERPECRDCGTTVLSGYYNIEYATEYVLTAKRNDNFSLGDGKSSKRIVDNLVDRLDKGFISGIGWHSSFSFKEKHSRLF